MTETTTEHVISLGAKLDALDLTAEEEAVLDTLFERAATHDEVAGFAQPLDLATNRTGKLTLGVYLDPALFGLDPVKFGLDPSMFGVNVNPVGDDR